MTVAAIAMADMKVWAQHRRPAPIELRIGHHLIHVSLRDPVLLVIDLGRQPLPFCVDDRDRFGASLDQQIRLRLEPLAAQFTAHAVRPDRLACRFDALSSDIPLLQIMKACVLVLRRHARSIETIRRLDELRFVLVDIADLPPASLPWDRVRIDRSNRRWEVLLSLARLFLKRQWQATHHAPEAGQGITLLFPMNDLFEAYITALMSRALRGTQYSVHAQGGRLFCLVEEGEFRRAFAEHKPPPQSCIEECDRTVRRVHGADNVEVGGHGKPLATIGPCCDQIGRKSCIHPATAG